MAIDIKELRKVIADCYWPTSPVTINELLDRLEAAESECLEQARLNGMGAEREAALLAKLEAAEKDIAMKEEVIDSLAAVVKRLDAQCDAAEKERDDVAQQLVQSERGKRAISEECDTLRAKIAAMEQQVPICRAEDLKHAESLLPTLGLKPENPLYALPGAQPQLNEIKITLKRALELSQRETWTGVRKHRSWEDQREEQQCWNKVWSLLDA